MRLILRLTELRPLLLSALLLVGGCAYFNTFYNARKYHREGIRLSEQRQVGQARASFEKAIEKSAVVLSRWPNSRWADDATFLIGLSYLEMEHYTRAIRHFDQLVLAFPESRLVPRARYYRGLAMLRNREYGPARVLLEQVRRDHLELGEDVTYELASSFYDREDWPRAADSLAAFIAQHPRSSHRVEAKRRLARSYERIERWEEAERIYRRLAALVPHPKERAEVRLKTARALLARERHDEAVPVIREILGRYPDLDDEANILLGRSLAETGRTEEALRTWRRVRGSTDLGAEAFFRIGRFHEERREFDLARAHYDSARTRRATSEHGIMAIKRLALLDAIARTDTAGERDPAEDLFLLAEVYNLNLAEYDEARQLYQAVADSFPDSDWAPKALLARAWIARYIEDDSARAETELRHIIARYPGTEYAYEARRWLGLPATPRKAPAVVAAETPSPPQPPPAPPPARPEEPRPPPEPEPLDFPPEEPEPLPEPDLPPDEPPSPAPEPVEQAVRPPPARPAPVPGDTAFLPVHFRFDRADISETAARALDRIAARLRDKPEQKLLLTGHCDPRGEDAYNLDLGLRRARAVADFLTRAGIEPGRIEVRTRGSAETVSAGTGEYWRDRRVEFQLQ